MKMKRKILGIVLVLVMLVSLMPSVGIGYASTPDSSAAYTVDTSATATQSISDYRYNERGATNTADGYELTAESGDFDARVWVTTCPLGNQVDNGGLTVSFTVSLPQTNAGAVYYCYSAEQNNAETYPFVGFKPTASGYRLLSNKENGNDTFYNNILYSGDVPVILYITSDQFELYVDGAYIATVSREGSAALGERWFYGFQSFWAGQTDTTLTVTDLKYLNGRAINGEVGGTTEAPVTAEPATEAPATAEPTHIPTIAHLLEEYDLSSVHVDGPNGTNSYTAPVLTMTKDLAGSNYKNIIWTENADEHNSLCLLFDAKVSGYPGYVNTWDGYAISLRTNYGSDVELVRIVPTETGVALTKGAGADVLATVEGTGYHAYSCIYDKDDDTLTVYVDGEEQFETTLGWNDDTQHGFVIKNGHNDATGCVLSIADVETWWYGIAIRETPGSYEVPEEGCTSPSPVTDAPVTEAPTTEAPSTAEPGPLWTLECPTFSAGQTGAIGDLWVQAAIAEGNDGQTQGLAEYSPETGLHMKKTGTQGGFCVIAWADEFDNADHTVPYTLRFTAKQLGGYAGNTWDGYGFSIRNSGGTSDTELIRLVPSSSGVDLYVGGAEGTKVKSIYDFNAHTYDVTFDAANNKITSIKVDGVEALSSPINWTAPPSYHGLMIKSGHNAATGVELYLTEMYIMEGETEAVEPGATEAPTEAPSQAPTEAPTGAPTPIQATIHASLSANGGELSGLTGSTTVVVMADATVTSGSDLDAVLAIIVYDGAGKIANIAYEGVSIDADISTSVTKALEAGFNLPSNIQGYKIRIAVYDNLSSLNQLASVSYTIE